MILNNVYGLHIRTVTGAEFDVFGEVLVADTVDGLIYYCNDNSYPAEIVTAVHAEVRGTS